MGKQLLKNSFPYIILYYTFMVISFTIGTISSLIQRFIPSINFLASNIDIPYEVIGWFWVALSSVYCGGTALLNIFTTRNLEDLSSVNISMKNLKQVTVLNYAACLWYLIAKILGAEIPLEAIVAATGSCSILVVVGKKVSETIVQTESYKDEDGNGTDDKIDELLEKIRKRKESGEFVDNRNSGKDDIVEDLEDLLEKRKQKLNQPTRN